MLMNLRNAMMAGKWLPYDAELEYLESTGTQWIDTGMKLNLSTDSIRMCIKPLTADTSIESYWGVYETIDGVLRYIDLRHNRNATNVNAYWPKETSPYYRTYGAFDNDAQWHSIDYDVSGMVVDGTSISMSDVYATTFSLPLFVFATNSSGSSIQKAKAQIASFSVVRNGSKIIDLIPVRVGTTGYLYDRVTRRLFGNSGTGDFVLGPDVVPVEYIESFMGSGGGQYINTGILATTSTKWEIDLAFTTTTTGQLMGSGYSGSNRFNIGIESNAFRAGFGGDWFTISNTPDTNRHLWRLESLSATQCEASIDGGAAVSHTSAFSPYSGSIILGKRYLNDTDKSGVRYYANKIWTSGVLVQNLLPVRVGSGSTWEGAMMDVLTRKIYRNAGSGAFTYGNDLRYPIPSE